MSETWLSGPPHVLWEPQKEEEKGTERKTEEIMAEKFSNLMEELNVNIQKPQWISSKIYSETHIKTHYKQTFKNKREGLPWLPLWWRICLPMQKTQIQPLIWGEPTCGRATKPGNTTIEPVLQSLETARLSLRATTLEALKTMLYNERSQWNEKATRCSQSGLHCLQLEKSSCSSKDSARPKMNKIIKKTPNLKGKVQVLKAAREERNITYTGSSVWLSANFSSETWGQ